MGAEDAAAVAVTALPAAAGEMRAAGAMAAALPALRLAPQAPLQLPQQLQRRRLEPRAAMDSCSLLIAL